MDNIERDTKLSTADITQAGEKEYEARHGQSRPGERIEATGQCDPALNRDDTPGSHGDEPMTPLYTDSEASSLRSRGKPSKSALSMNRETRSSKRTNS